MNKDNLQFSTEEIEEIKHKIFNSPEIPIYPFKRFFRQFSNYNEENLRKCVTTFIDLVEADKISYDSIDSLSLKTLFNECGIEFKESEIAKEKEYVTCLKALVRIYTMATRADYVDFGPAITAQRKVDMWQTDSI